MNFRGSDDLIDLMLVKDALGAAYTQYNVRWILEMPYVPYARQDRRMRFGEAASLYLISHIINALGFDEVQVVDPHSDVTEALFHNLCVMEQWECFNFDLHDLDFSKSVIVAPDGGALKKIYKVAQRMQFSDVVCASKIRDLKTGDITSTKVHQEDLDLMNGKSVWVVDDICDGGRTFTELAKTIRAGCSPQNLNLYVTHGIFSKGKDRLYCNEQGDIMFDNVFSYNDWNA
jgi:ribose-phosphate pyrophosphokinase